MWKRGFKLLVNHGAKKSIETAIHLDTNCLIRFAGGTSEKLSAAVLGWINQGVSVQVSAMAWAEFRCGPLTDDDCILVLEILEGIVPINREISDEASHLFNATGRRSRSLADCLIAATAIRNGAHLFTENRKDFKPFLAHGLHLA